MSAFDTFFGPLVTRHYPVRWTNCEILITRGINKAKLLSNLLIALPSETLSKKGRLSRVFSSICMYKGLLPAIEQRESESSYVFRIFVLNTNLSSNCACSVSLLKRNNNIYIILPILPINI